jgi:hypothetical protein
LGGYLAFTGRNAGFFLTDFGEDLLPPTAIYQLITGEKLVSENETSRFFAGINILAGRVIPGGGRIAQAGFGAGGRIASRLVVRLEELGKSIRPQVIAVLRAKNGRIVVGTNRNRVFNARVQEVLSYIGLNKFGGKCAEVNCISRALNKGIDIEGSTIEVLEVRGVGNPKSGLPKQFCDVCEPLTKFFEIARE